MARGTRNGAVTKISMPEKVHPMLCLKVDEPINSSGYLYEVKWDGWRIIAYLNKRSVKLRSRKGEDLTSRYPLIVDALKKLNVTAILDGEVVVFDENGRPDFHAVQLYNGATDKAIHYCVFDIIYLNGKLLVSQPLIERRAVLRPLIEGVEWLMFSEAFDDGPWLYSEMATRGWEGIIAKRKDSTYMPGKRTKAWLKIPILNQQEFVIGAWVESKKRRAFKSLHYGAYDHGKFRWVGRSGGGYKEEEMPGILNDLKKIEITKSPFVNKVLDLERDDIIHWVKPKRVALFQYADWTESGRIRKPAIFKGMREDKDPKEVLLDMPVHVKELLQPKMEDVVHASEEVAQKKSSRLKTSATTSHAKYLNKSSVWRNVDQSWARKDVTEFDLEHCTIELHDIERQLWTGVTKAHLIMYYKRIADYILPYIKERPQSLNLRLNGAMGPKLFLKDMEGRQPACATIYRENRKHKKDDKRDVIDYLVCNNLETLLFMVDVGCIDVNPWNAQMSTPDYPDYILVELDPTIPDMHNKDEQLALEDKEFKKAIKVAKAVKYILDGHGLTGFVKTSGKTGIHVYIPCSGFDTTKARLIAEKLAAKVLVRVPGIGTVEREQANRADKVYIDTSQNDHADTIAAPYCVRPYHKPIVSAPLDWAELNAKLNRWKFTMENIEERIKEKGDLFKGVLDKKIAKANAKQLALLLNNR